MDSRCLETYCGSVISVKWTDHLTQAFAEGREAGGGAMEEAPRHAGKTALVTGAGQGSGRIGAAIAMRLARGGARVLVADLDPQVDTTAAQIQSTTGRDAIPFVGDLSDQKVVERMVELAASSFGKIDILVNNAGGGIIKPFLEHTPDTLRETVARNLWTTVWCCHQVLPHMVRHNFGRIVNIGADSVRNGLFDHAAYNAAKGGVHGMTTGLAREFASYNITVNTVAPCVVRTERHLAALRQNSALTRKIVGVVPKGRGAEIEEVAAYVDFLAGDEAAFVTGQVVSVNGGSTML
jgi:2,3-dihydroxy-2,3-dihydro-p-cumate dehydrogenase